MAAIALETERAALQEGLSPRVEHEPTTGDDEAAVNAACQLAALLPAAVIITVTRSGETARFAARYRPAQPILAPTGAPEVYRRLALVRGVIPLLLQAPAPDLEATLDAVRRAGRHHGWEGQRAVFVSRDRVWTEAL
jgi:pyruvate kinase